MCVVTDPLLTSCGYCPWSILAANADDKDRKEETHRTRLHSDVAPDTDEMCARMLVEHADAKQIVLDSIVAVARVNGGQVDPNAVRELLPSDLRPPQVIGAVYRMLRSDAGLGGRHLVQIGEVVSKDRHGRNSGKPSPLYRLVDVEGAQTA